jgi:asparagine synthase (glutamine-hydrolysing)
MMGRLAHRGPDGSGQWIGRRGLWHVALGHRRLSIIDIEGGRQPLANEDDTVWITYNGEVFNFQDLRGGLERHGHRFSTRCDTECIVHAYEQHGAAGLADLHGMFAFAIWNQATGELLLARDRAGIKPLYYAPLPDGGLAFASELTALLECPAIVRKVSIAGLASYFFSDYAHPPRTLIEGVCKLPPGTYLSWLDGKLSPIMPFWKADHGDGLAMPAGNERVLSAELWERMGQAVHDQLVADVPVGVFLSGGIDSSTIAALAQQRTKEPIHTFSIGFEDAQFDEGRYARRMAAFLNCRHTEATLRESSLLENLDAALDCLDEPLGDPSVIPTYLLSRLAADHVKVVLGGDGGDELWGGYPTCKAHRYAEVYRRIPRLLRKCLIEPLVSKLPVSDGYQGFEWMAKRFVLRWDDEPLLRHLRWMSSTDLGDLQRAIPCFQSLPPEWDELRRPKSSDFLNAVMAVDFTSYLPGSVLTKVDRAAMAHGLEVRPPFLHDHMIDWSFSLPSHLKYRKGATKFLLKEAVRAHLPPEIVFRRKQGFAIPLSRWLRGSLQPRLDGIFQSSPLWEGLMLSRDTFLRWREEHSRQLIDRSEPLWAMLVLDHWARRVQPCFSLA